MCVKYNKKCLSKIIGIVKRKYAPKSILVHTTRIIKHRLYKKFQKKSYYYHVHDRQNIGKIGHCVIIVEAKPFSKNKRWKLLNIIQEGQKKKNLVRR